MKKTKSKISRINYFSLVKNISNILDAGRRKSAGAVNAILTATYWEIGRRIVEYEYQGMERVEYYGERLLDKLAEDFTKKFGRGFSRRNVFLMKSFYLEYKNIVQTLSAQSNSGQNILLTRSGKSTKNIV